ncbi:N-alpha-acetyltransferase mak3 [Orobanche gracilis]
MEGGKADFKESEIEYVSYDDGHHLPLIMNLVDQELSEPYSIFTYRYFVYLWPHLSFLAFHKGKCVGTIVCKMGDHRHTFRGYIAMLVVLSSYRGIGIGGIAWSVLAGDPRSLGCSQRSLKWLARWEFHRLSKSGRMGLDFA